jgi:predicted RNA-binding Zn-ribbon protein involved in translation (DUF1610 family)
MAPTSEERREVAERLRKTRGIMAFVEALGIDFDSDWCWTDVSRRVSDLIDPTCKNKLDELERMAPLEMRTDNFVCSACGETFCADPDGVNFPIDWAYCPNCGARVVRE